MSVRQFGGDCNVAAQRLPRDRPQAPGQIDGEGNRCNSHSPHDFHAYGKYAAAAGDLTRHQHELRVHQLAEQEDRTSNECNEQRDSNLSNQGRHVRPSLQRS